MPEVKPLAPLFLFPLFLAGAELRLGIIGGDGSKAIAFTHILNDASHADHLSGARVVAAYRGGRVDKVGEELRSKWKVEITPDVGSLCRRVDAVIIGSGAEQIKTVIAAGKPMYFESPLAANLEDARAIVKLAPSSGSPWFSASAIRLSDLAEMRGSYIPFVVSGPIDKVFEAAEILYTLMGTGCEEVSFKENALIARWPLDRVVTVQAAPPNQGWRIEIARSKDSIQRKNVVPDNRTLLAEIVKFFESGQPPVSNEETLEIFTFLDAAQRSKAAGGAPMKLR
jgi:hypothetical protein